MVIYYSRDPQGRRVEVQVSQQQHEAIQAGGGWSQSGAEAQVKQQVQQQYQEAVAKEQIRIEKIKEEAIAAGKTVLEKPSGEVIITDPGKVRVQRIVAAAAAASTSRVTAPEIEPRRIHREFRGYKAPLKPGIREPPPEMPLVHRTVTEFATEPSGIIGRGWAPYTAMVPGPMTEESMLLRMGELQPRAEVKYEEKPGEIFTFKSPAAEYYHKRMAKEEEQRIVELAPVARLEHELGFLKPIPLELGGRRDIGAAITGFTFGAVMFVPRLLELPKTAVALVTRPGEVIGGMARQVITDPIGTVPEIAGGIVAGYGISRLISFGVAKYRAKDITAATEVGQYTFDPAKGLGKVGVDIVIKKKGIPIELAKAQVGFKVGKKLFDPSVYAAEIVAEKAGLSYVLGKGLVLSKVTVPSGVSVTIAKTAGIMFKYPGFKKVLASAGISETLAGKTGLLRTLGLTVSKKGRILYGQKFYSTLFRKELSGYKITRIITKAPKVGVKPSIIPPVVGAEVKTIASMVGKAAVKPGPAITRTGVLTGAITAFTNRIETIAMGRTRITRQEVMAFPKAKAEFPGLQIAGPWSKRKKVYLEEELLISTGATKTRLSAMEKAISRDMLSITRLAGRGRESLLTLPSLGLIQKQAVRQRQKALQKQIFSFRQMTKMDTRIVTPKFVFPATTGFGMTFPFLFPSGRRPWKKKKRERILFPPPTKYRPSLIGLFTGRTIEQEMKRLTGAEIRYPVRRKRKGKGRK